MVTTISTFHGKKVLTTSAMITGCNLPSCWSKGRDEALDILKSSSMNASSYDFHLFFAPRSGMDLLCVFGDGKYPCINDEGDDEENTIDPSVIVTLLRTEPEAAANLDSDEPALTFKEMLADTLDPIIANASLPLDQDNDGLQDHSKSDLGIPSATTPPKGPGIYAEDYLWCKKKWVHKQSVCCLIISPEFTPKSQLRLLRVHGFTPINQQFDGIEPGRLLHGDYFVVGDIFLTFVWTQEKVLALTLMRCTQISENGTAYSRVNVATLQSAQGGIKLSGDVLALLPSSKPVMTWIWNGAFAMMASIIPGTSVKTQCIISVSVLGHFIELVNPLVVKASDHLAFVDRVHINSNDSTWALNEITLQTAIAVLWKSVDDAKVSLSTIPIISTTTNVPYATEDEKLNVTKGKGMHVALLIWLPTTMRLLWTSHCLRQEDFKYGNASKGSDNRPCRNVPIVCLLCEHQLREMDTCNVTWHYNVEAHLNEKHPEYAHPGQPDGIPLPRAMYKLICLTDLE
ncbi:hypothetical protein BU15DRAFT_64772 [Melanogaster broomeanus]|nr:hypothetical protein BU15DRAFT_64772 [Melanogaster broomeanus]